MSYAHAFPRPQSGDSFMEFANLDRLRHSVRSPGSVGSRQAEAEVAQQFEALLIQQMLKQARQASQDINPGLLENSQTRMVQGMNDEQLSLQMAKPGIGLAQALLAQMRMQRGEPADAEGGASVLPDSRVSGLRSSVAERRYDASSITALIGKLTKDVSAGGVFSAIRGAPQHIQSFVSRMGDAVKVAAQESGVHPKLIMSQAALESGWGKREILHADGSTTHNLFGIKATPGWKGDVATIMTTEYEDGQPRKLAQTFRAYDSYEEAFADYARLLGQSERYSQVTQAVTAEEAARRVQAAGYATDPAYADKLITIMGYLDDGSRSRASTSLPDTASVLAWQAGAAGM